MTLAGALKFAAQFLSGSRDNLFSSTVKKRWKVDPDMCLSSNGELGIYPHVQSGTALRLAEVESGSANLMAPHFHLALQNLDLLSSDTVSADIPWSSRLFDSHVNFKSKP